MRTIALARTAAVAVVAQMLIHGSAYSQQATKSEWVGGSRLFGQPAALSLKLRSDSAGIANAPQWRVTNRALSYVRETGDSLIFTFPSTTGALYSARGARHGNRVYGKISRGADTAEFHLLNLAAAAPASADSLIGFYDVVETASGQSTRGLILPSAYGHLRWESLSRNENSVVYPMDDSTYVFAVALAADTLFGGPKLVVRRNESSAALAIRAGDKDAAHLTRSASYRISRVSFRNRGVDLEGTLILPFADKPAPVVVFVPGSGDATSRDDIWYRQFDDFFLQKGVGIFVYDKRGTGKSGGDWRQSSFEDLALDVVAGVKKIGEDKNVDPAQIAVWGFSQGGWIAPLAATMTSDISLVMVASGGAVTPWESEIGEQVARMRVAKLSAKAIDSARAFMQLQINAVRGKADRARFLAAIPAAKEMPWYRYTWGGVPENSWMWNWWTTTSRYDPDYVLSHVRVPVLAIFGLEDELTIKEQVPGMPTRIQKALAKGGNRDFTGALIPSVGHDLYVKAQPEMYPHPEFKRAIQDWLLARVKPVR